MDPELIYSNLSGSYLVEGVRLEVVIVRLAGQPGWSLEVVNEHGTSTTWDEPFLTDQAAWRAFEKTVDEEGPQAFFAEQEPLTTYH